MTAPDAVFHALGDATRRAMVARISEGPISVSRLAEPFQMSLAAVIQHVQVLEDCGLVRTQKVGRVRTCSLHPSGFSAAEQWIRNLRSTWEKRLDRLGDLLDEESS